MMSLPARLGRLISDPTARRSAWLDGGSVGGEDGVFALSPDDEVRAERLSALAEVERRWADERAKDSAKVSSKVWIGWLTYEVGAEALCGWSPRLRPLAGVCLRRYPAALRLSRDEITGGWGAPAQVEQLRRRVAEATPHRIGPWPLGAPVPVLSADEYRRRVGWAKRAIAAGETYQINLSQPFFARWTSASAGRSLPDRAADVYLGLRRRTAPMGAFIPVGDRFIVSNSPETLVDVRFGRGEGGGDLVRAWPIKGTRPRGASAAADAAEAAQLRASAKDRAELVMIVDLVRNDLGRICRPGTVRAAAEPELLTLPTVHHLVTEVSGTLRPGVGLAEVTDAVFPGGSITGAPKKRTVELIAQLEDHERGVYCGAIVLLDPTGFRMSIPIRTGMLDDEGLTLCAGGGIVIDSDPEAERIETETKTLAFCRG
jgi:anthranilate/para-aminobenzoate synthase component I